MKYFLNNNIAKFLNLKPDEIETITYHFLKKELIIELTLKKTKLLCPQCGLMSGKVLNQYTSKINHGLFIG